MLNLKGFRPYSSRDLISKVSMPDFRDYEDFRNCMDFRGFRSDFRTRFQKKLACRPYMPPLKSSSKFGDC